MTKYEIKVTLNGTFETLSIEEFKRKDWSNHENAYMSRIYRNGKRVIDRIIIDVEEMNLKYIADLHKELTRLNAKHYFLETGQGFHSYTMTDPILEGRLNHQQYFSFVDKVCRVAKVPYDKHMASNPLSQRRIVGSINERTKTKCRYIDALGKPSDKPVVYGERLIKGSVLSVNGRSMKKEDRKTSLSLKMIPPCVKMCTENMMVLDSSHSERFIVMTYLYEYQEFDQKEVLEFLRKTLPADRFRHATKTERQHQHARRYSFPSCNKIKQQGFCTPCKFEQIRTFRKAIGSFS